MEVKIWGFLDASDKKNYIEFCKISTATAMSSYFVKNHSDSSNKFSESDIIKMLDFLIDNIFVTFGGRVYQQTVGIPMGTNFVPLFTDLFLY